MIWLFHDHTKLIAPHHPLIEKCTFGLSPLFFLPVETSDRLDSLDVSPCEYDLVLYSSTVYIELINASVSDHKGY